MTQKLIIERRKLNEGLAQDIREIKDMLASMQALEAARVEREIKGKEEFEELKKAVKGNGKLGLEKDVLILQQNEEKRKEEEKRKSGLMYTIAGAVIIQILMTIFSKVF